LAQSCIISSMALAFGAWQTLRMKRKQMEVTY
jgi:hypothetical protein